LDAHEVREGTEEQVRFDPQPDSTQDLFEYITDEIIAESEDAEEVETEDPGDVGVLDIGRGHRVTVWKQPINKVRWLTDGAGSYCGNTLWKQANTYGREVWILEARRCPAGDMGGRIALGRYRP
jgi:hypothetical protein